MGSRRLYDLLDGTPPSAFMIRPGWQGSGLGGAMQQRMARRAPARGVRGMVAGTALF